MPNTATYEDANLILRLYEMRREEKMRAARDWFRGIQVNSLAEYMEQCPPGSDADTRFRMVATYWEMVGSFITAGVLNEELFFQTGMELLACWERIKGFLPEFRAMAKNPLIGRNLEEVAGRYIKWLEKNAPEAYPAFSAMIQSQRNASRS